MFDNTAAFDFPEGYRRCPNVSEDFIPSPITRLDGGFKASIKSGMNVVKRPVQTHYTRTIQHSTLYDRHCIALLGKVFKRTIHGLYPLYKYDETENCGLRLPIVDFDCACSHAV